MKLFKSKSKSEAPVSADRFTPANIDQLTAAELMAALNKLRKAEPAHSQIVSAQEIFGDSNSWSPTNHAVLYVTLDGKNIRWTDVKRATANTVAAKTTQDCEDLGNFLVDMGKALKKVAPRIDAVRTKNMNIAANNNAIEDLKALYESQFAHEKSLDMQALERIENAEASERRIADLEATVAALTAAQADNNNTDNTTEEV